MNESFFYKEAILLNEKRIQHLDSLNLDFQNKRILETGSGSNGMITQFLLSKNAKITLNDVREENILHSMKVNHIHLDYNTWDLNKEIPSEDANFDIIICYGTLYHLTQPEEFIKNMSKICKEYIIISTCTSGKNDYETNILFEGDFPCQGLNGYGCRPGRLLIYDALKKNFEYVYTLTTQPEHTEYPLQFPSNNSENRNIFIGSHIKIENKHFREKLSNNYTVAK